MYKNLEGYLEQIDHYLVVKEGKNEILSEIKSHILEKTEKEFGKITDDTLGKVITHYGNPKKVAEKYLDGYQIISPTFKKHLFLYTAILFMLHFCLILISVANGWSNVMFFPFFFIPKMGVIELLSYVPVAFVYDFGLVSLFLYVVTQSKKEIRLPWPRLKVSAPSAPEEKRARPRVIYLILMLIGLGLVVFAYLRYHTLFFISLDLKSPASLLNPEASKWYSLFLITFIGCEIIGYSFRFFTRSDWVPLVINAFYLLLLWIILNNPIENAYVGIRGSNLDFMNSFIRVIGGFALALLAVLAAIDLIKSLIRIIRKKMAA